MPHEQERAGPASVAVIGGGPAGLMAAEALSAAGLAVTVYDRMPSLARKFLIAGRGGLNLTHSESFEAFVARYGLAASWLRPSLEAFPPSALRAWADGLGAETFVGSSGRVFPKAMKASPLLRVWLDRLRRAYVTIRLRHDWQGWDESGALVFASPEGRETVAVDATVLAMGGASWPRLGSNGTWSDILATLGIKTAPFQPANAGFQVAWSDHVRNRFAGQPLKPAAFTFAGRTLRGEAMITAYGIEGGAIYALSSALRGAITSHGPARLLVDLKPESDAKQIAAKLERTPSSDSLANRLRKAVNLSPLAASLLREGHPDLPREPAQLAAAIKAVPFTLTGMQGLDRAISSAGGVQSEAVTDDFMLRDLPGTFVAGEMLDWEAPTGGYLLQACFATGLAAARGVLRHLSHKKSSGGT